MGRLAQPASLVEDDQVAGRATGRLPRAGHEPQPRRVGEREAEVAALSRILPAPQLRARPHHLGREEERLLVAPHMCPPKRMWRSPSSNNPNRQRTIRQDDLPFWRGSMSSSPATPSRPLPSGPSSRQGSAAGARRAGPRSSPRTRSRPAQATGTLRDQREPRRRRLTRLLTTPRSSYAPTAPTAAAPTSGPHPCDYRRREKLQARTDGRRNARGPTARRPGSARRTAHTPSHPKRRPEQAAPRIRLCGTS